MSEEETPAGSGKKKKSVLTVAPDTAGQGLKAVVLSLTLILLFLLPNLAWIGVGIAGIVKVEFTRYVLLYFVLTILVAAAACLVAAYFTYEYFLIDTIRVVYDYLIPVFKLLCTVTAGRIREGKTGIIKKGYDWSENIADSFQQIYNSKVPRFIRWGIRFILEQIPFADIMYHVSIDTGTTDTAALGADIYTQMDAYINKRFFEENTMKWILWFLPVNLALQGLLFYLLRR